MNTAINIDDVLIGPIVELIETGDIVNVINYAKEQKFWDNPINEYQELLKEKLEARFESENLEMDIIHTT